MNSTSESATSVTDDDQNPTIPNKPARVVVDFDNTHLAALPNAIPSSFAPVRDIRLGQSRPDAVRLVIDLDHAYPVITHDR